MSFVIDKIAVILNDLNGLFINSPLTVFTLMVIAMLMGTFAMFKSLLTFAFKSNPGFNAKSINVMSFMLSFIGTTGIAFMYSKSPTTFIYIFGGGFGYFLVLFLVVFVFKIMHMFAEELKDEKGMFGKGGMWVFFMILATLLSSYMLLGYTGKILSSPELGCSINGDNVATCNGDGTFLYAKVYNIVAGIIAFLVPFAIFFGIWMLIKKLGGNDDEHGNDEPFAHKHNDDQENAEHVSHLIKEFNHGMHEAGDVFKKQSDSLGNLQNILNNRGGH